MTLKQLLDSFIPNKQNESYVDLEHLGNEFNLPLYGSECDENRLKKYYTNINWICTDTSVGIAVVMFDFDLVNCTGKRIRYTGNFVERKLNLTDWFQFYGNMFLNFRIRKD